MSSFGRWVDVTGTMITTSPCTTTGVSSLTLCPKQIMFLPLSDRGTLRFGNSCLISFWAKTCMRPSISKEKIQIVRLYSSHFHILIAIPDLAQSVLPIFTSIQICCFIHIVAYIHIGIAHDLCHQAGGSLPVVPASIDRLLQTIAFWRWCSSTPFSTAANCQITNTDPMVVPQMPSSTDLPSQPIIDELSSNFMWFSSGRLYILNF